MQEARASILISADGGNRDWLKDSIQSAILQKYPNCEVIVASHIQDREFGEILRDFDSDIKHLALQDSVENPTWRTILENITGEVIFFLLPGDKFHPQKIREHMSLRKDHPEVHLSYNACFLVDSKNEIWHQATIPPSWSISDLINYLPMRVNNIVVNREAIQQIKDLDFWMGSAAGDAHFILQCISIGRKVAGINKPLDYQKQYTDYYSISPDSDEYNGLLENLDQYFNYEPRLHEAIGLHDRVLCRILLSGAFHAFLQSKSLDAQKLIRAAIRADRSILDDQGKIFLDQLIYICLTREDVIESDVDLVLSQLPPELHWITQYRQKVIASAYLQRGIADVLFERTNQAEIKFRKSASFGINLENQFLLKILTELSDYAETFGSRAAKAAVQTISNELKLIGKRTEANWLVGTYFINSAFSEFQQGKYDKVITDVLNAIFSRPILMFNVGVASISLRSAMKSLT